VDAGDSLTLTVSENSNTSLLTATINGSDLTLDYLLDQNGTTTITIRATDSGGLFVEDTFTVTVLSPQEQLRNLCTEAGELVDSGVLNAGQGNSLCVKLTRATEHLDQGDITTGVNQIQSFIHEVEAFLKANILTGLQAQPLIDAANAAIASALPALRAFDISPSDQGAVTVVTAVKIESVMDAAIASWGEADIDDHILRHVNSLHVYIADLPHDYLGLASSNAIWIDRNAAGHGWSLGASRTSDRMDLLSVISHELGHVLGFDHDADHDVMAPTLSLGNRSIVAPMVVNDLAGAFAIALDTKLNRRGNDNRSAGHESQAIEHVSPITSVLQSRKVAVDELLSQLGRTSASEDDTHDEETDWLLLDPQMLDDLAGLN